MVTVSCFLGTKFLKGSKEMRGQVSSVGALHGPATLFSLPDTVKGLGAPSLLDTRCRPLRRGGYDLLIKGSF